MAEETLKIEKPKRNWLEVGLLVLGGLALITVSAYTGYWYANRQQAVLVPSEEKPSTFAPLTRPTPTVEDQTANWKTYTNSKIGYKIKYPEGAIIDEDAGLRKPNELRGKKTCVHIKWGLGYVAVSAPENKEFGEICLRTGVGYDVKNIQDTLRIEDKVYKSGGWEEIGPGETLDLHNEFHRITLENGITIEYGSTLSELGTYEDYLSIKDYIVAMVESLQLIKSR